jgi:hypothetical protein
LQFEFKQCGLHVLNPLFPNFNFIWDNLAGPLI